MYFAFVSIKPATQYPTFAMKNSLAITADKTGSLLSDFCGHRNSSSYYKAEGKNQHFKISERN